MSEVLQRILNGGIDQEDVVGVRELESARQLSIAASDAKLASLAVHGPGNADEHTESTAVAITDLRKIEHRATVARLDKLYDLRFRDGKSGPGRHRSDKTDDADCVHFFDCDLKCHECHSQLSSHPI